MEKKTHLLVLREIKGLAETSGFLAHFPLLPLSGGKQLFLRQKGDQRHGQGRQTEVDCCADIESHYLYYLTLFAQQAYLIQKPLVRVFAQIYANTWQGWHTPTPLPSEPNWVKSWANWI